jgi:thioredoxin-dependent peroxiredoxin
MTTKKTTTQKAAFSKTSSKAASTAKVKGRAETKGSTKIAAPSRLDVGAKLPDVILEDQLGKPFQLASLRGKLAIVYFYPRDDTPGCTREACAFQAELSSIVRLGATVVGISPDPVARHAKFAEKYGLRFPLLVDANREFARACGVLVPKTLYGKTSIGIERTTFLVDKKGIVQQVWRKVKVEAHAEQVKLALRALSRE